MDVIRRIAAILAQTADGLFGAGIRALVYLATGRDLAAEAAERVEEQARQEQASADRDEVEADRAAAKADRETTVALGEEQLAALLEVKRLLKASAPPSVETQRRARHAAIRAEGEIEIRSSRFEVDGAAPDDTLVPGVA